MSLCKLDLKVIEELVNELLNRGSLRTIIKYRSDLVVFYDFLIINCLEFSKSFIGKFVLFCTICILSVKTMGIQSM